MLLQYELYPLIGIIAGFLAGLFGIGGGILLVPLLSLVLFYTVGLPEDVALHFALGTAAAVVLINTAIGSVAHRRLKRAINWQVVKAFLPGLLFGASLGVIMANVLDVHLLSLIVAIFLMAVVFTSLRPKTASSVNQHNSVEREIAKYKLWISSFIIAALSCMIGSSGTTFTIPYFLRHNLSIQEAMGIALPCAIPLSMMATFGFISSEPLHAEAYWHTGFIYWPALFGVLATSVIATRAGTLLSHHFSPHILQKGFAMILLVLAIKMFLTGIGL